MILYDMTNHSALHTVPCVSCPCRFFILPKSAHGGPSPARRRQPFGRGSPVPRRPVGFVLGCNLSWSLAHPGDLRAAQREASQRGPDAPEHFGGNTPTPTPTSSRQLHGRQHGLDHAAHKATAPFAALPPRHRLAARCLVRLHEMSDSNGTEQT